MEETSAARTTAAEAPIKAIGGEVERRPVMDWNPTDAQRRFAEEYVRTGELVDSYRKAYPNNTGKYLRQDAWRLLNHPKIQELVEKLQADCRSMFVVVAPAALERVIELAANADSEKVKLQANLELLDRAGLGAAQKVELQHLGIFGAASTDMLRDLIRKNIEENREVKKHE